MCSCMRTAMDVSNEVGSEVKPSDVASFARMSVFIRTLYAHLYIIGLIAQL